MPQIPPPVGVVSWIFHLTVVALWTLGAAAVLIITVSPIITHGLPTSLRRRFLCTTMTMLITKENVLHGIGNSSHAATCTSAHELGDELIQKNFNSLSEAEHSESGDFISEECLLYSNYLYFARMGQ